MSADGCVKCGTTDADTWRYCETLGGFVCIACERRCPSYSRKLLPNGTNCIENYKRRVPLIERQLNRVFLSFTKDVDEAREYWEKRDLGTDRLYAALSRAIEKHDDSVDAQYKANARAHITALQLIIKERRERDAG